MQPEIRNKLKQALTGKNTVEMGQFKWVNLDMVRREAGGDWDRLRRKIYSASGDFIERRLGEGDVLLRCQGGFMIIFGTLEGDAAAEKVEEISLALNVFFLGDRILRSLKVEAEARSISPEEFMQIVATSKPLMDEVEEEPPAAELDEEGEHPDGVLAKWREQPSSEPPPAARLPKTPSSPNPEQTPEWRAQSHERIERTAPNWQNTDQVPEAEDGVNWQEGRPTFSRESLPKWEEAKRDKPKSGVTPNVIADPGFLEPSAEWDDVVFLPSWDSRRQALTWNFSRARREYRNQTLFGSDVLLGNDSLELLRALDRSVAIAGQRAFQVRHNQGANCVVGISVHYPTIAKGADRTAYFSLHQPIPKHVRKFFLLRVDAIPDGAPLGQMQDVLRSVKGFGASLMAMLRFGDRDLRRFEGCGVDTFGVELPAAMSRRGPKDDEVMALAELVASARLLKAEIALFNVDSFDVLEMALATGVRFFAGDAISGDLSLPAAMQALSLTQLKAPVAPEDDDPDVLEI